MSDPRDRVAAARRGLEAVYGLALEVLSEEQVAAAVEAASGDGLADPADPRWLERLVDRLPIDESWLFRDEPLWKWIAEEGGPELLDRALAAGRPVRALSLGCSSGQEPFSLALAFQSILERAGIPPSSAAGYVQIVGVDCSPARIAMARAGAVNGWSVQRAPPERLRGRVVLDDPATGRHRVDGHVREMCRFEVGNLLELAAAGNAAFGGFDLVLCRHVLIYFRAPDAERTAAEIARALDPGTLLVVSAAEAHLLGAAGCVEPLAHLGAGRIAPRVVGAGPFPGVTRSRARASRRVGPTRGGSPRPQPRAAGRPRTRRSETIARHLATALEHSAAGRSAEALREARAALFHDPRHLFSRMLVGKHLIDFDVNRGRELLQDVLETAQRMPPDDAVPAAEGLSVKQLAAAVRLLLGRPEGR